MTQGFCRACKRIYHGEHHCPKNRTIGNITVHADCSTDLPILESPHPLSPKAKWIREIKNVCNVSCPHWGTVNGSRGCMLVPERTEKNKPCDIRYFWAKGNGCFADEPRYKAFDESEHRISDWVSYEELRRDLAEFSSRLATMGLRGIAGVPRSGMMVASELAVRLGLPLYTLDESGLHLLGSGLRLRGYQERPGPMLVMEDSSANGRSIREAREWCDDDDVIFGAIYATANAIENLDIHHKQLELPHWFEWNLLGNPNLAAGSSIGVDFDGILCPDFTAEEDDDGPRYLSRLASMPVIRHPGVCTIRFIVTARLEKYREPTEQWLRDRRINVENLIMGPWESQEERSHDCIGSWKAEQCIQLGIQLFIESCREQAGVIAKKTKYTTVICPSAHPFASTTPTPANTAATATNPAARMMSLRS